jgi:hypothetical protein
MAEARPQGVRMATLNQRNRIVVFRLTQDEYNSLKSACVASGGRNMSDFTRSELLTIVQSNGHSSAIEQKFAALDRKLTDLHNLVQRIAGATDAHQS